MAAAATVSQFPQSSNLLIPRSGVVTLYGYGITVHVDRGHLILKDGIGSERFEARLPRVGHRLRRLVVIGSDGSVSLAALRWLCDQDVAFVLLERDGKVLAATGPVRSSDARLRRAQALTAATGAALEISKELIRKKLSAQEHLLIDRLSNPAAAQTVAQAREKLADAKSIDTLRLLESRAAYAYWSAWHNLAVTFPKMDLKRVPEHWLSFGARISPLTGSPRLSVNPPNAMLNYLYAILESECRSAAAALGLDPGLGFMHVDSRSRDSLACDLMEPLRPLVDANVFDWITREQLHREWFFEQRDGSCRLMAPFAARLSETAQAWERAVAPIAEWVVRTLWATIPKRLSDKSPATWLTQANRREGRGVCPSVVALRPPKPPRICLECGASITPGRNYCMSCGVVIARQELIKGAKRGRVAAQSPQAQARRTATQRRNAGAQRAWDRSSQGASISEESYKEQILPRLANLTLSTIKSSLNVCTSYAADIRSGRRRPHPRHWERLAQLVGVSV
jgi:CRISPR-associated endonuclease Cas1